MLPAQVIGQMNMKQFIDEYAKAGVTVNVFSDPDKAMTWLAAQ